MVHPCPRHPLRESGRGAGSVVCAACVGEAERCLRSLPALYQECLHQVSPGRRRTNPTRVSGSRNRDQVDLSVLDVRLRSRAVLQAWADVVAEGLGVSAPARSVPQLARFLAGHLAWLAAQPPAGDFAEEMQELVTELSALLDPEPAALHTLHLACVVEGCAGTISAAPKATAGPGTSRLECTAGHSWPAQEWLALRPLMTRQRKDVTA